VRLREFAVLAVSGTMLAGCATTTGSVSAPAGSPNPFGYLKTSAVCTTTPVTAGADGQLSTTMTVRSDDGLCELKVSQPGGGAYASFGVDPVPEHGKALIYDLDSDTHITYTPTLGYAGTDEFVVTLIPIAGGARQHLKVSVKVDATGVVAAKPVVPAQAEKAPVKAKAPVRRRAPVKK